MKWKLRTLIRKTFRPLQKRLLIWLLEKEFWNCKGDCYEHFNCEDCHLSIWKVKNTLIKGEK